MVDVIASQFYELIKKIQIRQPEAAYWVLKENELLKLKSKESSKNSWKKVFLIKMRQILRTYLYQQGVYVYHDSIHRIFWCCFLALWPGLVFDTRFCALSQWCKVLLISSPSECQQTLMACNLEKSNVSLKKIGR